MSKYTEYKSLNLSQIGKDIKKYWDENNIFEKSVATREGAEPYVFYEGPPSANGMPGIHHVMARAIKDIFCRYQTLKGKQVKRKAGWDTHGLPIELAVEKTLGIKKEDIGTKITVEDYNKACRKEVMKYTDKWEELTSKMGYWVDMNDPYITYDNKYIESVWWLLKNLHDKKLLYKGYTIQPYSPAAGTGLSSHELNQPGCYKNVKDTSAVVQFKVQSSEFERHPFLKTQLSTFQLSNFELYFLAWTTTPWTLPSNTALAVGKNIDYVLVKTVNPFTRKECIVIVAEKRVSYFFEKNSENTWGQRIGGDAKLFDLTKEDWDKYKGVPLTIGLQDEIISKGRIRHWQIINQIKGSELAGIKYEQLLPFEANKFVELNGKNLPFNEAGGAVVLGDFVTTEDGTGIVHIAPSFGADDYAVARKNGIGSLTLVDKRGKFLPEVNDGTFLYGDEYVKEAYLTDEEKAAELAVQKEKLKGVIKDTSKLNYLSVDERIVLKLQNEGKLFKKEKYEHNYPHCWRTDKPVLYYPLDSWFVKVTEKKSRMFELNKTINWKPESTGTGRFGNWLENANDWNLSRSRFWGIPLPIWRTEDSKEEICIGSVEQLKTEIDKSVAAGVMKKNPLSNFKTNDFSKSNYETFDLHKPYADEIILVSASGKEMRRESDLIDVWFDSGAMPYAQLHYPFENKESIDKKINFPADFIAEGVDQTRGWFYTLHAIATMCFDSVAYKNVISNGLVLDKNGNKMSKRLGNAVDPFETIEKFGPDATRWYMITNAAPWDNLKFDIDGITEVQRGFFGKLHNTYSFFALYANIDGFNYEEAEVAFEKRPTMDRWILSELNTLIKIVDGYYNDYEPHQAGRAIEQFMEVLSNWYVRLNRRRFWKGEYSEDKVSAYQTLYRCLETLTHLISPIAPFYADHLYRDLNTVSKKNKPESIHLSKFPVFNTSEVDVWLEKATKYHWSITELILSIRKKENIRVRQPLSKLIVAVANEGEKEYVKSGKDIILSEVNVKELLFADEYGMKITKTLKLNFKTLGKKCGKDMKAVQAFAHENQQVIINAIEKQGKFVFPANETIVLEPEDIEVIPVDIPGWKVASYSGITVALDITVTSELKEEGVARELINRIQNLRKDKAFEVTDKIMLKIQSNHAIDSAVSNNLNYICSETLATSLELVENIDPSEGSTVEVSDDIKTLISISKFN